MRRVAVCWMMVLCSGWLDAQVLVSRRTYAQQGRSFQQIWIANAGTLDFRQITYSARDHVEPACSGDGKLIYFVSDRDAERSRNGYGHGGNREVWVFDRKTGQERLVWQTSQDSGLSINGVTANGGLLVHVGNELRSLVRNPWSIDNADDAALSPDGRRLALLMAGSYDNQGQSRNVKLVLADAATGQSRTELGKYSAPAWSPDGTRIAAFADAGLAILDTATRREIERVGLPKPDWPRGDIVWSPDHTSLLMGIYGESAGSGDPQNDYFRVTPATRTVTPSLTARQLLWLQGETVLYLRPFETTPLAPGSRHIAWTSQLGVYDLVSHKDRALTSGLALNDDLASCGR